MSPRWGWGRRANRISPGRPLVDKGGLNDEDLELTTHPVFMAPSVCTSKTNKRLGVYVIPLSRRPEPKESSIMTEKSTQLKERRSTFSWFKILALGLMIQTPANGGNRPFGKVESLELNESRWTKGFWADRFEICRSQTIPAMWQLMSGTHHSQYLENFRVAAGLKEGRYRGAPFNDGDFYKWLESACAMYGATGDALLDVHYPEVAGRCMTGLRRMPHPSSARSRACIRPTAEIINCRM